MKPNVITIETLRAMNADVPNLLASEFVTEHQDNLTACGLKPYADAIKEAKPRRMTNEQIRATYSGIAVQLRTKLDMMLREASEIVTVKPQNANDVLKWKTRSVAKTILAPITTDGSKATAEAKKIRKSMAEGNVAVKAGVAKTKGEKLTKEQKKAVKQFERAQEEKARTESRLAAKAELEEAMRVTRRGGDTGIHMSNWDKMIARMKFFAEYRRIGGMGASSPEEIIERYSDFMSNDEQVWPNYVRYRRGQISAMVMVNYAAFIFNEETRAGYGDEENGYHTTLKVMGKRMDAGTFAATGPNHQEKASAQAASLNYYDWLSENNLVNYPFQSWGTKDYPEENGDSDGGYKVAAKARASLNHAYGKGTAYVAEAQQKLTKNARKRIERASLSAAKVSGADVESTVAAFLKSVISA